MEAFISFGLSDYTWIQEQLKIHSDSTYYDFSAGANQTNIFDKALYTPLPCSAEAINKTHTFSMKVSLRGSEYSLCSCRQIKPG